MPDLSVLLEPDPVSRPKIFLMGLVGLSALLTVLSIPSAEAHPSGAAVSTGSNPVVSVGGHINGTGSVDLFVAPADQVLVITDVTLSLANGGASCEGAMGVTLTAGSVVRGAYGIGYAREGDSTDRSQSDPQVVHAYRSGLPVSPGETLTLATTILWDDSCVGGVLRVYYTVSGYYAQP
jgi:hypothetical protein